MRSACQELLGSAEAGNCGGFDARQEAMSALRHAFVAMRINRI